MQNLRLQFPISEIETLADRYSYRFDDAIVEEAGLRAQARGFYSFQDFLAICGWKSPRTVRQWSANDQGYVEEVTKLALGTGNERLRIEVLTLLKGVNWPTASVFLHLGFKDRYPILDFWALESSGIPRGTQVYTFDFWTKYTEFCRALAERAGVSMRILDRALWQFSREKSASTRSKT